MASAETISGSILFWGIYGSASGKRLPPSRPASSRTAPGPAGAPLVPPVKVQAAESDRTASTEKAARAVVFGRFTSRAMRSRSPRALSVIMVAVSSGAARFSHVMRMSVRP